MQHYRETALADLAAEGGNDEDDAADAAAAAADGDDDEDDDEDEEKYVPPPQIPEITEEDVNFEYRRRELAKASGIFETLSKMYVLRGNVRLLQCLFYMLDYTKEQVCDARGRPDWQKIRALIDAALFGRYRSCSRSFVLLLICLLLCLVFGFSALCVRSLTRLPLVGGATALVTFICCSRLVLLLR
jgi:hypothetical protein